MKEAIPALELRDQSRRRDEHDSFATRDARTDCVRLEPDAGTASRELRGTVAPIMGLTGTKAANPAHYSRQPRPVTHGAG
jgi:hypothetical protein